MGATRLASENFSAASSPRRNRERRGKYARYKIIAASFPEAGRLAPISACVCCLHLLFAFIVWLRSHGCVLPYNI